LGFLGACAGDKNKIMKSFTLFPIIKDFWIASLIWLCAITAQAEPLNVMVGDLTFTRPEGWKWETPPTNLRAMTQFIVPGENGEVRARVLFYVSTEGAESLGKAWKGWFRESDLPAHVQEEHVKMGKRDIYFLTLHGTFTKSRKPQPDFGFIGVMIPVKGHFIQLRMEGPQAEVQKASNDFRKMIAAALKEEQ
jgi:hypothetical protein